MSQSVILRPDENGNNPVVNIGDMSTSSMMPVNVSYHESQTIQTHNAVSVSASSYSVQTNWMDCLGYDKIGLTLLNDAATSSTIEILWSNDGSNIQGQEIAVASGTPNRRSGITDVKARYAKVQLDNGDTVAHTMSAWAMLKA